MMTPEIRKVGAVEDSGVTSETTTKSIEVAGSSPPREAAVELIFGREQVANTSPMYRKTLVSASMVWPKEGVEVSQEVEPSQEDEEEEDDGVLDNTPEMNRLIDSMVKAGKIPEPVQESGTAEKHENTKNSASESRVNKGSVPDSGKVFVDKSSEQFYSEAKTNVMMDSIPISQKLVNSDPKTSNIWNSDVVPETVEDKDLQSNRAPTLDFESKGFLKSNFESDRKLTNPEMKPNPEQIPYSEMKYNSVPGPNAVPNLNRELMPNPKIRPILVVRPNSELTSNPELRTDTELRPKLELRPNTEARPNFEREPHPEARPLPKEGMAADLQKEMERVVNVIRMKLNGTEAPGNEEILLGYNEKVGFFLSFKCFSSFCDEIRLVRLYLGGAFS